MPLSDEQIKIIVNHPLNDLLACFPAKLRNLDDSNQTWRDGIAILLQTIIDSSAACNLPSSDGGHNVASRLFTIRQNVRGGLLKFDQFRPLVNALETNSDTDIWTAVINLVAAVDPSTPPRISIPPTFNATPIRSSSSRLADTENREIVELELFEEIRKCTFRGVGGFWDKFFDSERWHKENKTMLQGIMTAHNGEQWVNFPSIPEQDSVWEWLRGLEDDFFPNAQYKLHTTTHAYQLQERKGQFDIFFQTPAAEGNNTFYYKNVLVVGELKLSFDSGRFKADFLQLARYVRGVFTDQPTRRFVHAFTLCADEMELWVFDRSGPYSSGRFNIHKKPDNFARAIIGYATMDNDAMGLDIFTEREGVHRYTTVDDVSGNEKRLRLDKAMVRQRAIVCRGTTCYRTEDGNVAKFSWASDKRKLEVEQLKLAELRGVKGVAKVVAHRQITTIAQMRKGLDFKRHRHRFRNEDAPLAPRWSDHPINASGKSFLPTKFNDQLSTGKTKPSLYAPSEDLWENRIYSCLVVSPAGRVISAFESVRELLESLRDAIKAHRSLYVTGNILHRDISSNNIIITQPTTAGDFKGMLIDLDLAKVRDSVASGARHQTGTMQFMAVEVLCAVDHTYRHDLESFFYVLIWMCAREVWTKWKFRCGETPPKQSILRRWEIGSFEDIADFRFEELGLLVKFGSEPVVSIAEGQCLWALQHALPSVPVPEIYGWARDGDLTYLFMELVSGITLENIWSALSRPERTQICTELRYMLKELRSLRQEPGQQFVGHINRAPLSDKVFTNGVLPRAGPFTDVKQFHDWLSSMLTLGMEIHWPDTDSSDIPDPYRHGLPDDAGIVFTHSDLHPSNILISQEKPHRVISVIDWQQSGWYPDYWEFCKAEHTAEYGAEWQKDYIPQFLDEPECVMTFETYAQAFGY
ncbi:serine/threonine-protein kinase Sgk2 [Cordyceps militaris CM01]|uniref:EKC/KEOPS complex subunit BUD32 n=1 Tax=Cordyceps militaris (strain CM01) TaxID=983644 RepID=G3JG73_CORMM|nr:serine/threonine-protein kinase Sgk2 [Cordyceps militaris CM01]EGX92351.1 serine/threonine-protein kinase Sgk2 [Cordyceps militaris CM01]